jgi:hypothetical protein
MIYHPSQQKIVEDFALETFQRADDEDRAGKADKNTAKTFYASGTFMDALKQFGEMEPDVCRHAFYTCMSYELTLPPADCGEGQVR